MIEALTMIQASSLGNELQVILREDSGRFLLRLDEGKITTMYMNIQLV